MNNTKKLITLTILAALAVSAMGQGFGGRRGGGMMARMAGAAGGPALLLTRDDVKDEIKLSNDQRVKVSDTLGQLQPHIMAAFQAAGIQFGPDMTDEDRARMRKIGLEQVSVTAKEVVTVLNSDQTKRLRELFVQMHGNAVATNPDFAKDLGLGDEQTKKIDELQQKMNAANNQIMQDARQNGDFQSIGPNMEKNRKILEDQIGTVLNAAQKAKIKEWAGAPFTFKDDTVGGGR